MPQATMVEAAVILGVSPDTVKRRLQRGELKGHQEETPQGFRWIIELPDDFDPSNYSSAAPADAPAAAGAEETLRELVDVLKDEVSELRQQLQTQATAHWEQLEAKDKQIEQLHILLQQAQAALPAPRDNRHWWQRLWRRD
jgi:thiamine pyrophosphate-dependent acetolactate synthase large subunit-like protein